MRETIKKYVVFPLRPNLKKISQGLARCEAQVVVQI